MIAIKAGKRMKPHTRTICVSVCVCLPPKSTIVLTIYLYRALFLLAYLVLSDQVSLISLFVDEETHRNM